MIFKNKIIFRNAERKTTICDYVREYGTTNRKSRLLKLQALKCIKRFEKGFTQLLFANKVKWLVVMADWV